MKSTFVKFRFTSKHGTTAGLIIETDRFHDLSISDLSRFFPYSEARYMDCIQVSPSYPTWETAFNHEFDA